MTIQKSTGERIQERIRIIAFKIHIREREVHRSKKQMRARVRRRESEMRE